MEFAFVSSALDREGNVRDDSSWVRRRFESRAARALLLASDGRVLIALPDRGLLGVPISLLRDRFEFAQFSYLGAEQDQGWFALTVAGEMVAELAAEFHAEAVDLRLAAAELKASEASAAALAKSLSWWQSRSRFCGVCGAPTVPSGGGHRALCSQPSCAAEFFPRTDAAMIVLVHAEGRCLLGRQASWPEHRFSTLAGFLEPGETLEDCVRREVFEEAGIRVGACQYVANQPWPFPASLMVGFTAQAESSTITVGAELAEARWFSVDELRAGVADRSLRLSPRLSISRYLIERWVAATTGSVLTQ
ncbi:MAG: NAD(+) diphosphatase [Lysobacterales bacterium CG02_land_8_20_14_3_00_62_12]|nr:MAG: NAD(+) diphosphatase [Xanthomonadales bacterium CG02_land_8_20_14_3_00_62_12]